MIPAGFGLAIGNSGPVGHAVGHNRTSSCTAFRVSGCRGADALSGEWGFPKRPAAVELPES
jgi:hypothetical protein